MKYKYDVGQSIGVTITEGGEKHVALAVITELVSVNFGTNDEPAYGITYYYETKHGAAGLVLESEVIPPVSEQLALRAQRSG